MLFGTCFQDGSKRPPGCPQTPQMKWFLPWTPLAAAFISFSHCSDRGKHYPQTVWAACVGVRRWPAVGVFNTYIYIYILSYLVQKVDLRAEYFNPRIRNFCILAERELTFRKRPSWKPQHLVTMSHKQLTFHYWFLPSLINLNLFTTYSEYFSLSLSIYIYCHTLFKRLIS